jgi:competence ComEA-like helix-hairpin-helix protein
MKPTGSFVLGMAACALVASTLIGAAPLDMPRAAAQQKPAAADDPAAGVFAETCAKCHDAARITALRRTGAEWEDVIKKMIEKGAPGSEKDFETVYDYLLRNFGKVFINAAPPSEIVAILGLSEKDAKSIVAYRDSKGPFADFDAVKKVPDIDLKKLDEHKDAVAF